MDNEKQAVDTVTTLLRRYVPRDSVAAVTEEFKKDFVFSKKRSRRAKQRRARSGALSRAEKRALGFYNLPRDSVRYEDALGMHELWREYMRRLLEQECGAGVPQPGARGWEAFSQSVHRAELQGARACVVRSRCPSLVGTRGVIVLDTRCTFTFVTENNRLVTVPKRQSVFELELGELRLGVFGKHLCVRPAERSVRKVKCLALPDL